MEDKKSDIKCDKVIKLVKEVGKEAERNPEKFLIKIMDKADYIIIDYNFLSDLGMEYMKRLGVNHGDFFVRVGDECGKVVDLEKVECVPCYFFRAIKLIDSADVEYLKLTKAVG